MANSKARITCCKGNHWVEGICGEYIFEAKLFDEPSMYGINEGRVSKLAIWPKGKTWASNIVNYDRGWDHVPGTDHDMEVCDEVLDCLENAPKGIC